MARKKVEETAEEVVEKQEVTEEVAEAVPVKKAVTLTKDGVSFTLSNPIMISAFENQGYQRV